MDKLAQSPEEKRSEGKGGWMFSKADQLQMV